MNQRRTENAVRGFINRAHGKQFEDEIKTTLDFYKRVKLAAVDKTPEPMRVL